MTSSHHFFPENSVKSESFTNHFHGKKISFESNSFAFLFATQLNSHTSFKNFVRVLSTSGHPKWTNCERSYFENLNVYSSRGAILSPRWTWPCFYSLCLLYLSMIVFSVFPTSLAWTNSNSKVWYNKHSMLFQFFPTTLRPIEMTIFC